MHAKRLTGGIVALSVLFLAVAAFTGDGITFFLGLSLLSLIALRSILFDRVSREVTGSIRVERILARPLVLEARTTRVSTKVTLKVPPGVTVRLREILPTGIFLHKGTTEAEVNGGTEIREIPLLYEIMPRVHGTLKFPGISLRISDRFFDRDLSLTAPAFGGTEILVQPSPGFEPASRGSEFGTREIERSAFLTGLGVRGFREYVAGDDLRQIDWKLSAKHDKLLIREYMGMMRQSPLLIIDLPDRDLPYDPSAFQRMVRGVAGSVEHSIRTSGHAAYLLISGVNLVAMVPEERQVSVALNRLRDSLHPMERSEYAYRSLERRDIRRRIRILRAGGPEEGESTAFRRALLYCYESHLKDPSLTRFSGQVARALSFLGRQEIVIFSLLEGDQSHIRAITAVGDRMKAQVSLKTYGQDPFQSPLPDELPREAVL